VLIFDEVMTGFRLALGGAQERFGVTPDMTTLGKIVGGGLPVGAYGGRKDIMQTVSPVGPVYQAGTLSGNPLATASGIATLESLKTLNPYPQLDERATKLCRGLKERAEQAGLPHQINQVGSMFTLFFTGTPVTNLETASSSDTQRFSRYFHGMLDRGVYLPCSQFEANFLGACHTEQDLEATVQAAGEIFEILAGA
jgi:glutamate-1-semialdehyde 2,1-aminomutase